MLFVAKTMKKGQICLYLLQNGMHKVEEIQ